MFELLHRKKTPKELWDENRAEFLKIYASEQSHKISHSDLEKWFVDSDGNQYWKFPKLMSLPLERQGMLDDLYSHLLAGISGAEMKKLVDSMDKILSAGVGRPEVASQLGAIVHVLKERQKLTFHTEILYNILAVQAIRDDERPDVYNNEIQMEKVVQFKKEVAASNAYFFFQQTQLSTPLDILKLSLEEFMNSWEGSLIVQKSLQEILDLVHTLKESKKLTPTSASN